MSEKQIINDIQLLFSKHGHRIFRQNTGQAWAGDAKHLADGTVIIRNPRPLKAGLCVGSSDLIGWRTREITIDMVGQLIAQFCAIEAKFGKTKTTPEQLAFIDAVARAGGYAAIVRSLDEVTV